MSNTLAEQFLPEEGAPTPAEAINAKRDEICRELDWIERLAGNDDFKRFIAMWGPELQRLRTTAGNITGFPADTRDASNQRLLGMQDMVAFIPQRLAELRGRLAHMPTKG